MAYEPVTTLEQLNALDGDAILTGYRAARGFIATDHTRTDQAYWFGYFNAQADMDPSQCTPEMGQLCRAYCASLRAN